MKLAPWLLGFVLLAPLGLAPSPPRDQPVKRTPDMVQMNGHTIRILRMGPESYGYEIRRGADVFVHQRLNPFTGAPGGLRLKADALKAATWVLQNVVLRDQALPPHRRLPERSVMLRSIPPTVATQLGVAVDDAR